MDPWLISRTTWANRTRPLPLRTLVRFPRTSILHPPTANSGVAECPRPGRVVSFCGGSDGSGSQSPLGCYCWYRRAVAAWPDPGARLQRPPRRSRPSSSRMRGTRRLGPLCRLLHPRLPPYCLPPRPETTKTTPLLLLFSFPVISDIVKLQPPRRAHFRLLMRSLSTPRNFVNHPFSAGRERGSPACTRYAYATLSRGYPPDDSPLRAFKGSASLVQSLGQDGEELGLLRL